MKLGEEPTRTLIGEFAGNYKAESTFLTDLVGRLPFYTPATRSQVTMGGALGVSIPNPNTKDRAYVDDFDGARVSRELSMSYIPWKYSSIPQKLVQETGLPRDTLATRRGEQIWYTPRRGALRRDLNPKLSEDEGDDGTQVLEWWMTPTTTAPPEDHWYGLTQAMSTVGEDLSTTQFLEVWVNDFRDQDVRANAVLYIDIGEVSEDAVWWSLGDSLGPDMGFERLDTEDANGDGRLDESVEENEDTGLDGIFSGQSGDHSNDDWDFGEHADDEDVPEENKVRYAQINGTEGNSKLDSEDLDSDGIPDTRNHYFTYRFPLSTSDPDTVVTNVYQDFDGILSTNGWRRIRFPLGDGTEYSREGNPDWTRIKHVRIWMTGVPKAAPVQLASVELIGNKWLTGGEEAPVLGADSDPVDEDELLAYGEKFAISEVSNKENGDIYEPAFDLQRDRNQAAEELERYLSMDLFNFQKNHTGTCYRRFAQDQDYTLYETIEFYTQLGVPTTTNVELEFFIRLGPNDRNTFYEYRRKVRSGNWQLVELPLKEFSNLKHDLPSNQQVTKQVRDDGSVLTMVGRPSLTRVRRITMGVTNSSGQDDVTASVWVNELRLDDVLRRTATASQFNMAATLSDLATLNFNWKGYDADFLQVGQTRGRGTSQRSIDTQSTLHFDRFVPRLQMRLPLTASYSRSVDEPKFQTGSEITFEGENQELNIAKSISKSFGLSYSRTPSQNPLLRYTIDGFSGNYSVRRNITQRPTYHDTNSIWDARLGYSFSTPRHELVRLPLGMRFDYLPSTFSVSGSVRDDFTVKYQRPSSDLTLPLQWQNSDHRRSAALGWRTSYRMLNNPNIKYDYSSDRDLMSKGTVIGGMKLGVETNRTESLSASYSFSEVTGGLATHPIGRVLATVVNDVIIKLRPNLGWSSRFNGRTVLTSTTETIRPRSVNNSARTTARITFPLRNFISGVSSKVKGLAKEEGTETKRAEVEETRRGRQAAPPAHGRRPGGGPRAGGGRRPDLGPEGEPGKAEESAPRMPLGGSLALQDINVQFSRNLTSSFTSLDRMPSIPYQLGLTRDAGPEPVALVGNSSQLSDQDQLEISSGFKLRRIRFGKKRLGSTFDLTARYTRQVGDASQISLREDALTDDLVWTSRVTNHTTLVEWPDIQVSGSSLEKGVPFLEKRFRSITLRSRYARSEDVSGDQFNPETSIRVGANWTPFFQLDTSFKNGMRLTIRSNKRKSENIRNQAAVRSITTTQTGDFAINLNHTMQWKKHIPNPLGRGKKVITTSVDLSVGLDIRSTRTFTSSSPSYNEVVQTDNRTLTLSTEAGYKFTRNIHGTAEIEYIERKDNKTLSRTSRSLGLTLAATFQF